MIKVHHSLGEPWELAIYTFSVAHLWTKMSWVKQIQTEKLISKASLLFCSGHYSLFSVVVSVVLTEMMYNQVPGIVNEIFFSLSVLIFWAKKYLMKKH